MRKRQKKIKAWAVALYRRKTYSIEPAWELVGQEDNELYFPLAIFDTRRDAKEYLDYRTMLGHGDSLEIIKVEITLCPKNQKH